MTLKGSIFFDGECSGEVGQLGRVRGWSNSGPSGNSKAGYGRLFLFSWQTHFFEVILPLWTHGYVQCLPSSSAALSFAFKHNKQVEIDNTG